MPNLAELREEIAAKAAELHEVYQQAGPNIDLSKVQMLQGTPEEKGRWIRERNEELSRLGAERSELENLDNIRRLNESVYMDATEPVRRPTMPGGGGDDGGARVFRQKGLKQTLLEHAGYKQLRDGRAREISIEMPVADFKTLITLSTVNSQAARQDPVNMALEERTVADLMSQGATDRNVVEYYEETTVTNSSTMVSEGAAKPESALAWTLRTETIRKAATWIPATREALDDVSWLESQIRNRLAFMVRRREEIQILGGDGNAPNLPGLLGRSGVQTQAKGALPNPDAIYLAMQKVRGSAGVGFAEPTALVINPNDWSLIKLLRAADGTYLYGPPGSEAPDSLWSLPVRQTTAMTAGTALVGAFRPHAEVIRREGITVTLSTEHSTYFTENKVAILAESRLALAVYRPTAFCTITGIA
jgi:HK97 family phage major capsid protein